MSVLFGLHDYNSEFYVLEHASGLINSSFGIGADVAQIGPSIFPTTSLAARIAVQPTESSYMRFAAYDGVPGSPYDNTGTQISLGGDDGVFYAGELGLVGSEDSYYKAGVGSWYSTSKFEDFNENGRDSNYGVYGIGEISWTDSFGTFAQFGWANSTRNQLVRYYGVGATYKGLFPTREDDILSLGVAIAENGDDYIDSFGAKRAEAAFELNYRYEVAPYLALTPDIQFVVNPGTDPQLKDAVVVGLRTELVL